MVKSENSRDIKAPQNHEIFGAAGLFQEHSVQHSVISSEQVSRFKRASIKIGLLIKENSVVLLLIVLTFCAWIYTVIQFGQLICLVLIPLNKRYPMGFQYGLNTLMGLEFVWALYMVMKAYFIKTGSRQS